jgi:hypothetical protein
MAHNAIDETEGEGGMPRQVGFIDLRVMFLTRKENKVFNLARSLKEFIAADKAFNKDCSILPLFGDGSALCKPMDIPNSQDQLAKFDQHQIGNNNVNG